MTKLIITETEEKLKYLKANTNSLIDCKFMSKDEFFSHYYFKTSENVCLYLMQKYNKHIDICKNILKSLYIIDVNKNYKNVKLKELQLIKKDLLKNNMLDFDSNFKDYIKRFDILVTGYYELEKYEEDVFKSLNAEISLLNKKDKDFKVYKYKTKEDEIIGIAIKVRKLLDNNIDINNIYLLNVKEDDYFLLKKVFSYFNIPLNINYHNSIYDTKLVQDYLKKLDNKLLNNNTSDTCKKLINVINSLVLVNDNSKEYKKLLISKLKTTNIKNKVYKNAVNILNLYTSIPNNYHVFCMSFNQDILPNYYKDEDFLNDNLKQELDLYNTNYKNNRLKNTVIDYLSNIDNLCLSYHEETSTTELYKSPLIDEYNMKIEEDIITYNYSDIFNKIKFASLLDNYVNYNMVSDDLKVLYSNYQNSYNTYDNSFKGLDNIDYLDYLKKPLRLSYSSMNNYNLCPFKYYVNNTLKIDPYEETFAIFIGNLFHYLLSVMHSDTFDFDMEWEMYLTKRELSIKEVYFLEKLKKDFRNTFDLIKREEKNIGFIPTLFEHKITIPLDTENEAEFTGIIDKIMTYKNIDDTYYMVIDYKTGSIETSLNNLKYGLNMQLAIYLYLINKSKLFETPLFAGIYFQRILNSDLSYNEKKSFENMKLDNLKLDGYSTDNLDILSKIDINYENSKLIKSLKYDSVKGFSVYSKILSEKEVYNLELKTEEIIKNVINNIYKGDFSIAPKVINNKNVSCMYCKYKDLCYVKNKDIIYLDKVDNLDFLGGDDNA